MKYPVKAFLFLLLSTGAVFLIDREEQRDSFASLNRSFVDWLVGNASGQIDPSAVTLLRVNPADLEEDNLDPRLDWAIILKSLEGFEPRSVGIVPALRWDTPDPLAEGALHKRLLLMPDLALGAVLGPASGDGTPNVDAGGFTVLSQVNGDTSKLSDAAHIIAMPDEELRVKGTAGFTHIELQEETNSGPNGIRMPLVARLGDQVVASFILQLMLHHDEIAPEEVRVDLGGPLPSIKLGDKHTIPITPGGHFTVYHGVKGSFPSIDFASLALAVSPFEEVAQELRKASEDTLNSLRTNAVIIGFDDEKVRQFELPTGEKISRAEVLAMALATIQTGRHITFWPPIFRYASWAILGLAGLMLFRWRRLRVVAGALGVTLLYAAACIAVFQTSLSWTPPWPALGICALLLLLGFLLPGGSKKSKKTASEADEPETGATKAEPETTPAS